MADQVDNSVGWRKSSKSTGQDCVEVRLSGESVQVRNSRDRFGPVFSFSAAHWSAFLAGIRSGEFDRRTRA
jgi:hypothetical protein